MSTHMLTPDEAMELCTHHIEKCHLDDMDHIGSDTQAMLETLAEFIQEAAKVQKCDQITFYVFRDAVNKLLERMADNLADPSAHLTKLV